MCQDVTVDLVLVSSQLVAYLVLVIKPAPLWLVVDTRSRPLTLGHFAVFLSIDIENNNNSE